MPTMSQVLVENKPGRVFTVCIQETYSISVANVTSMLPKSCPVLSVKKGVVCHQNLRSNHK